MQKNQSKYMVLKFLPLLEITFLNKDLYTGNNKTFEIPNKLDAKNIEEKKKINFDKYWIKKLKIYEDKFHRSIYKELKSLSLIKDKNLVKISKKTRDAKIPVFKDRVNKMFFFKNIVQIENIKKKLNLISNN